MADIITGLSCPNCAGRLEVREGQRIVKCPYCEARSQVVGERGARRYQVKRQVERTAAEQAVRNFWTGFNKAIDLSRQARLTELFLVYLPYWRGLAQVAGWIFGQKKVGSGKRERYEPREVQILENMEWTGAAGDVAEFGVESVSMAGVPLAAYAPDALHAEGMVFEPTGSQTEAQERARRAWSHRALNKAGLNRVGQSFLRFWRATLALVYYPLWVGRYIYRQRAYQVVVDGASGKVLYGKAPGNIYFRALMLLGGTALGSFVLVDGLAVALAILGNSNTRHNDNSFWLLALPFVGGAVLIGGGYRLFRWGEEVETRVKGTAEPPALAQTGAAGDVVNTIRQIAGW
jgi:hypothetical protein